MGPFPFAVGPMGIPDFPLGNSFPINLKNHDIMIFGEENLRAPASDLYAYNMKTVRRSVYKYKVETVPESTLFSA